MGNVVLYILILAAVLPLSPVYFYALEAGMSADLTTIVYVAGLPVGAVLMLITVRPARRSNPARMRGGSDEKTVRPVSGRLSGSSKPLIIAFILVVAMILLIYPIRFYALSEKALFAPLVY